jgi:hypothetical protein
VQPQFKNQSCFEKEKSNHFVKLVISRCKPSRTSATSLWVSELLVTQEGGICVRWRLCSVLGTLIECP